MVKTVERWVESEPIRYQTERWRGTGKEGKLKDGTTAILYQGEYDRYKQGGINDRAGWGNSGEYRIYIYDAHSPIWLPEFMITTRNTDWAERIFQMMEEGKYKTLESFLDALRHLYHKCNCTLTMSLDYNFRRYLEELYIN